MTLGPVSLNLYSTVECVYLRAESQIDKPTTSVRTKQTRPQPKRGEMKVGNVWRLNRAESRIGLKPNEFTRGSHERERYKGKTGSSMGFNREFTV